jgi:hypothetical protein
MIGSTVLSAGIFDEQIGMDPQRLLTDDIVADLTFSATGVVGN